MLISLPRAERKIEEGKKYSTDFFIKSYESMIQNHVCVNCLNWLQ